MVRSSSLLLSVALFLTHSGYAQTQLSVDIPDPGSIYEAQTQSNWCWAACNVMLLRAKGISATQVDQAQKLFGTPVNQGAGPNYEKAKKALMGRYDDGANGDVMVVPYVSYLQDHRPNDPLVIIDHLNNGIPLVMATPMHGVVCVGVDYITNGQAYQITGLRLLDPDPASEGRIKYVTMTQFLQQGLIGFMTFDVH